MWQARSLQPPMVLHCASTAASRPRSARACARVGGDNLIEFAAPAAGDDHLVAERVERLSKAAADARSAAVDEDGIACEFSWVGLQRLSDAEMSRGEAVAEHRQPAGGLGLRRLVLEDVPVLGELAVCDAYDVG